MPNDGMVQIPAEEFLMGSEDFYPEEAPVRRVTVEGFWMDERYRPAARQGDAADTSTAT